MSSPSKDRVGFLDLPPELRNQIYMYALAHTAPIMIINPKSQFVFPALLYTCTQIRREASAVFYGANTFQAFNRSNARQFLNNLSDLSLSAIRCFRADRKSRARLYKNEAYLWLDSVRLDLNYMNLYCARRKIKPDAIVMPLLVGNEDEPVWFSSKEEAQFDYDPEHRIIRRQMAPKDQRSSERE